MIRQVNPDLITRLLIRSNDKERRLERDENWGERI